MVATPLPVSQEALFAARMYIDVFAGRQDAYSYWDGEKWRPAGTWDKAIERIRPIPLTPERVIDSFRTGIPLSSYVLGVDNHTHLAALDIDRADGMKLGKRFIKKLVEKGGWGYLEASRRGCHVWMPLSQKRPGIVVLRALRALCNESGMPMHPDAEKAREWRPADDVELRPASATLTSPGGLDHSIRMPTMRHQRTGQRYGLIDPEGTILPAKLTEFMPLITECPVEVFDAAAERAPLSRLTRQPTDLRYPFGQPETEESATALLIELWNADPAAAPGKVISCPAIAYHSNGDRHKGLSILRDDERAICHRPGCILNNDDRGRGTRELRALAPTSS